MKDGPARTIALWLLERFGEIFMFTFLGIALIFLLSLSPFFWAFARFGRKLSEDFNP